MVEEKYSTNLIKTKYVNDSKITDHYALIPTGQGFENYEKLSDLQKNVYKLYAFVNNGTLIVCIICIRCSHSFNI